MVLVFCSNACRNYKNQYLAFSTKLQETNVALKELYLGEAMVLVHNSDFDAQTLSTESISDLRLQLQHNRETVSDSDSVEAAVI